MNKLKISNLRLNNRQNDQQNFDAINTHYLPNIKKDEVDVQQITPNHFVPYKYMPTQSQRWASNQNSLISSYALQEQIETSQSTTQQLQYDGSIKQFDSIQQLSTPHSPFLWNKQEDNNKPPKQVAKKYGKNVAEQACRLQNIKAICDNSRQLKLAFDASNKLFVLDSRSPLCLSTSLSGKKSDLLEMSRMKAAQSQVISQLFDNGFQNQEVYQNIDLPEQHSKAYNLQAVDSNLNLINTSKAGKIFSEGYFNQNVNNNSITTSNKFGSLYNNNSNYYNSSTNSSMKYFNNDASKKFENTTPSSSQQQQQQQQQQGEYFKKQLVQDSQFNNSEIKNGKEQILHQLSKNSLHQTSQQFKNIEDESLIPLVKMRKTLLKTKHVISSSISSLTTSPINNLTQNIPYSILKQDHLLLKTRHYDPRAMAENYTLSHRQSQSTTEAPINNQEYSIQVFKNKQEKQSPKNNKQPINLSESLKTFSVKKFNDDFNKIPLEQRKSYYRSQDSSQSSMAYLGGIKSQKQSSNLIEQTAYLTTNGKYGFFSNKKQSPYQLMDSQLESDKSAMAQIEPAEKLISNKLKNNQEQGIVQSLSEVTQKEVGLNLTKEQRINVGFSPNLLDPNNLAKELKNQGFGQSNQSPNETFMQPKYNKQSNEQIKGAEENTNKQKIESNAESRCESKHSNLRELLGDTKINPTVNYEKQIKDKNLQTNYGEMGIQQYIQYQQQPKSQPVLQEKNVKPPQNINEKSQERKENEIIQNELKPNNGQSSKHFPTLIPLKELSKFYQSNDSFGKKFPISSTTAREFNRQKEETTYLPFRKQSDGFINHKTYFTTTTNLEVKKQEVGKSKKEVVSGWNNKLTQTKQSTEQEERREEVLAEAAEIYKNENEMKMQVDKNDEDEDLKEYIQLITQDSV